MTSRKIGGPLRRVFDAQPLPPEPLTVKPKFVGSLRHQRIGGGLFLGIGLRSAEEGRHWLDDRGARTWVFLYESQLATLRLRRWGEKIDPHEGRAAALDVHHFHSAVEERKGYLDATPLQFRCPAFLYGVACTMHNCYVPAGRQYEYDDVLATIMGMSRPKQIVLAQATHILLGAVGAEVHPHEYRVAGLWLPRVRAAVAAWAGGASLATVHA